MARTSRRGGWLSTLVGLGVAGWLSAGSLAVGQELPASHVRGVDRRGQEVVRTAQEVSRTVQRYVRGMEDTDVIVLVQVTMTPMKFAGDLRLLADVAGPRYVLVRLDGRRPPADLVATLAHELQHAREVADAADVRDEASFARLMERIGWRTAAGVFETDAARQVSDQVRLERREAR